MEKKYKRLILILGIIFSVLILFLIGYILYTKIIDNSSESEKTSTIIKKDASELDGVDNKYCKYTNEILSFEYPCDWNAYKSDTPLDKTSIIVENERFVWELRNDPYTTGGGFGFWWLGADFGYEGDEVKYEVEKVSPTNYDSEMGTIYFRGSRLTAYMPNKEEDKFYWGYSVLFNDANKFETLGFGDGVMYDYDKIPNNFWGIRYIYKSEERQPDGTTIFTEPVEYGSDELVDAIKAMNDITNSLEFIKK